MKILPMALSSPFKQDAYEAGKKVLLSRGYEFAGEAVLRKSPSLGVDLNGTDTERLQEFQSFLASNADFVWAVRGGYGITRLLARAPELGEGLKPQVIGFSDTTALMLHLWAKFKQVSIHAPVITRMPSEPPEVLDALDLILKGRAREVVYPKFDPLSLAIQRVAGTCIPANLCMLTQLIGTSSMPDLAGCILILEDISERAYQIDRMLTHLYAAGVLKGVKALIVGHLTECGPGALEVFKERSEVFKVPCFTGFPMGHESPNWPVPMGMQAEIIIGGGKACFKIC
jgi:muramoyltetrapeptide carboxypeptidase